MARVTVVKKAQQRYATVPVLNEDGTPKVTPVLRKDGTPKVTKKGKTVTMRVTRQDRTQPKPLQRCDFSGCTKPDRLIQVGESYKWIKPKSGPYGGRLMTRHAEHPSWNVWEYSSSLSARLAQITDTVDTSGLESPEDVSSLLEDVAQQIRDLAEEKREGAQNIVDGFGHETYQSEELEQTADSLDEWADDVEAVDVPDLPEAEEEDCAGCEGTGEVTDVDGTGTEQCDECNGTGQVTADDPTDDQMDEWRQEAEDAIQDVLGNCPV